MVGDSGSPAHTTIEAIVAHAGSDAERDYLRCYFGHVARTDLESRRPRDLFGLAADHLQLALGWEHGTVAIRVLTPTLETDGWEPEHTVILTVTDDLPFLVDSVTMELNRLGVGIHLIAHPVVADCRAEGEGFRDLRDVRDPAPAAVSLMAIEIDRQSTDEQRRRVEQEVLRVIGDVRVAVADWHAMQEQMRRAATDLGAGAPFDEDQIAEHRELLSWLADDHFIFLGYREYELTNDDGWVLVARPETGLGILRAASDHRPARLVADMAPAARDRVHEPRLLNLTKAGSRATVHRAAYMDYVGVKEFDADGQVVGERRFIGLFTSEFYSHSVDQVPLARRLVASVVERAGFSPMGHDEKRLRTILETFPRDELLQMDEDELFDVAIGITELQERRRIRVFARHEVFGRFVTCIVYLPRDRYNTESRTAIEGVLCDAYGGSVADWTTRITDSVLARLVFLLRVDEFDQRTPTATELESSMAPFIRQWDDDLVAEIASAFGEEAAIDTVARYRAAFPPAYRSTFDARSAVADIQQLEALAHDGEIRVRAYREPGRPPSSFGLKLYRLGDRVSLTRVMPTLSNLGVTVLDERPYEIRPDGRAAVWLYDFSLEHRDTPLDFGAVAELVEEAIGSVLTGDLADDQFNRLILTAGIRPERIRILRTYSRYIRQAGTVHSQMSIARTLEQHAGLAKLLVDLFLARFEPDSADRAARLQAIDEAIDDATNAVERLDHDRLIRRFRNLITSTLRTTYFQVDEQGRRRPYLAVKLDPTSIEELPEPRPRFEIFVYSARFEGVHLRAGLVARGGLRWSDRLEDYRTEVLGLVKAQMVKNAVIVPAGAKGGFVLKRPPPATDRAGLDEEVVACYRLFVSALLDLTDNLVDDEIVAPTRTVRYDGDDHYLVVAADKGTASFSDVANELALARGFWLGDAFASGGSNGYDHKTMGITARGAWESVKRHFRELDHDVQRRDFTVVAIGDMSGDVFGNGMLRSRHIRLVAAFDHRHIFVDPDPDPVSSFDERARLFELPGSSWADYDRSQLSPGGGVHPRSAKSIELDARARAALGTTASTVTPDELISIVLRAPVDLLWNGGVGTYVKASDEPNVDVGDKANDGIRVDGADLRCRVVGEGGNLGLTQRGRVEFARAGGCVYTDAIDNAGGVDCSDHEVNIKILLDRVVADGDMTGKQRNELLDEMTHQVADLVLRNNYLQTQALSVAKVGAASLVDVHGRYLTTLEADGVLDRDLEHLPDSEQITELRLEGTGLTTPELAVLLAHTKNNLQSELLESTIPDDDAFDALLLDYFPDPLREGFADRILRHRLRREIVANRIANRVVDRGGTSMIFRLTSETATTAPEVAAAHMAAWAIFELDDLADEVNRLDTVMDASVQQQIHLAARQLAERATRHLLRHRPQPVQPARLIAELADPVREAVALLPELLVGGERTAHDRRLEELLAAGTPASLARRTAVLVPSIAALDIVEISVERAEAVEDVAAVHFSLADALDLPWLRDRIVALPRDDQWSTLARLTLVSDLNLGHRQLTTEVASLNGADRDPTSRVGGWLLHHAESVASFRRTVADIRSLSTTDLTHLFIATREIRDLVVRTGATRSG